MFLKKRNQFGYTILEALVAISVVVVGLFSALALVLMNVKASRISNDKLNAYLLSWEGIEISKNIRDSNWLANDPWDNGIGGLGTNKAILEFDDNNADFIFDFTVNDITDDKARMYFNPNLNTFTQAGGSVPVGYEGTKYYRLITFESDGDDIRKIKSEVQWDERGEDKSVVSEIWLYNWRKY